MGLQQLTKCELEVMDVVWQLGRATVQEVMDHLARPLAYTTVMTTLGILESKRGVLKRSKRSRAFVYEPTVSRDEVSRSIASDLQDRLFGGSPKSLLLSLLQSEKLTKDDIAELREAIRTLEKGQ